MQGKIIKGIAGFYYVHIESCGIYECKAKGIFRNKKIKPLVGDNVIIDIIDNDKMTGNIIQILPRKNELIRPASANDTIRRVVIYFDANDAGVNPCYKGNNQVIAALDSLFPGNLNTKYITALNVETFVSPDGNESDNKSLVARRNDSIKEFLQRYNSDVSVDKIHFFSPGDCSFFSSCFGCLADCVCFSD